MENEQNSEKKDLPRKFDLFCAEYKSHISLDPANINLKCLNISNLF